MINKHDKMFQYEIVKTGRHALLAGATQSVQVMASADA
jgi:hypothetical protein